MKNALSGNVPYPVGLILKGKNCLVVGGGTVALRKANTLLEHEARVTVISPELCSPLKEKLGNKEIGYICKRYTKDALESIYLVIAATNDTSVNRVVSADARRLKILVNVVDNESLSDFILPAFLKRGSLSIAVSTSGKSPALARKLKEQLEEQFGQEYGELVELIGRVRRHINSGGRSLPYSAWQEAINTKVLLDLINRGLHENAEKYLIKKLEDYQNQRDKIF